MRTFYCAASVMETRTWVIRHKIHREITILMDVVVDEESFKNWKRVTNHLCDFDVNQLYFNRHLKIKSMCLLDEDIIKDHIRKGVFVIAGMRNQFSLTDTHYVDHDCAKVSLAPTKFAHLHQPVNIIDYAITDKKNSDCLPRSGKRRNYRTEKIIERMKNLESRGWRCHDRPNSCTNPMCIFSSDELYNKYSQHLIPFEERERKLHRQYNRWSNAKHTINICRDSTILFHFKFEGKDTRNYEKKVKCRQKQKCKRLRVRTAKNKEE